MYNIIHCIITLNNFLHYYSTTIFTNSELFKKKTKVSSEQPSISFRNTMNENIKFTIFI